MLGLRGPGSDLLIHLSCQNHLSGLRQERHLQGAEGGLGPEPGGFPVPRSWAICVNGGV